MALKPLLELFDELCECAPDQRETRLCEIADLDAAVAMRLRALLKADDTGTEFFAHDIDAQDSVALDAWRLPDRSAYTFGAYRMLRELGSGGMGAVWLAQRSLGSGVQQVAIKFMHLSSNAQLLKQFERERDALARLEHPNIARLIDAGLAPNGEPYIACEFVDGTPLVDFVRAHKLDLAARLQLVEALCAAVDYAHRRLLVHRDIKPSNVLVDNAGQVRLLDFGIAKALDLAPDQQTRNNPLSPAYAAPEQALGQPISTATDVFGLGLLLFELLTGQLPAQRRALTANNMAHKIGTETIDAPSFCSFSEIAAIDPILAARDWPKRLRGDLDLIVLKALKREPERRYPSALALAEDLRRFRSGQTIAARPDSTWYRWRKLIARNRVVVGTVSVMLLALIGGFGIALWQANVARLQAQRADLAAQKATDVRDFFVRRLAPLHEGRADLLMRDWIEASLPALETELSQSPEAQAELGISLAQALNGLGQYRPAIQALDTAIVKLKKRTYSDAAYREAVALTARASAYLELGDTTQAELDSAASLALFDQVPVADEKVQMSRISARTTLLRLVSRRGEVRAALAMGQANLSDRIALLGIDAPQLAVDHHNLSSMQLQLGDYSAAKLNAERALDLLTKTPEAGGARNSNVHLTLALLALAQANYPLARAELRQVRALRERYLMPAHPDTLVCGHWEATLAMLDGKLDQAELALGTLPELKRAESLYYAPMMLVQAQLRLVQQRPMDALAAADEVLARVPAGSASPYANRLTAIQALALARIVKADPERLAQARNSIAQAERAIQAMFKDNNFSPLFKGDAAIYLAAAYSALGATNQAQTWRARGLQCFIESMDQAQAEHRAFAWVGQ